MLKPSIFREYDIRGIADVELKDEDVELLGRALGTYLIRQSGRKINLGRDCRLSGPRLHGALLKGLLAAGCDRTLSLRGPILTTGADRSWNRCDGGKTCCRWAVDRGRAESTACPNAPVAINKSRLVRNRTDNWSNTLSPPKLLTPKPPVKRTLPL